MPTCSAAAPPVKTMAMIGTSVSGERRADGREDAADGPLAEVVAAAEPLHAVGEEFGGREDDRQRNDEQERWTFGGRITEGAGRPAAARPFRQDAVLWASRRRALRPSLSPGAAAR